MLCGTSGQILRGLHHQTKWKQKKLRLSFDIILCAAVQQQYILGSWGTAAEHDTGVYYTRSTRRMAFIRVKMYVCVVVPYMLDATLGPFRDNDRWSLRPGSHPPSRSGMNTAVKEYKSVQKQQYSRCGCSSRYKFLIKNRTPGRFCHTGLVRQQGAAPCSSTSKAVLYHICLSGDVIAAVIIAA